MRSLIHSLCGGVDTPLLGGGWLNCIFECGGMCVEIKGVVLRCFSGTKSRLSILSHGLAIFKHDLIGQLTLLVKIRAHAIFFTRFVGNFCPDFAVVVVEDRLTF